MDTNIKSEIQNKFHSSYECHSTVDEAMTLCKKFDSVKSIGINNLTLQRKRSSISFNFMNDIKDEAMVHIWDDVLTIQTKLFIQRELTWLSQHEYDKGKGSIEIGSASGYHGSYIASNFPNLRIYGLEANPALADYGKILPENYSIDKCVVGKDDLPEKVVGNYTNIFMRYVLQHLTHPSKILKDIYNMLPEDGKLFIIEDDLNFARSFPYYEPYEKALELQRNVCKITGSNSQIGNQLPRLLSEAGFKIKEFKINLTSNVDDKDLFLNYLDVLVKLLYYTRPDQSTEEDYELMLKGIEDLKVSGDNEILITFSQVFVVATKK
jgi:hypothetical protein